MHAPWFPLLAASWCLICARSGTGAQHYLRFLAGQWSEDVEQRFASLAISGNPQSPTPAGDSPAAAAAAPAPAATAAPTRSRYVPPHLRNNPTATAAAPPSAPVSRPEPTNNRAWGNSPAPSSAPQRPPSVNADR
ncbi:hypothetical protein BDK51DRAFT_27241, partial [Blyttiomyces helicus]